MEDPIWKPSADRVAESNMTIFRRLVAEQIAPEVTDYPQLYRWSVEHPAQFWNAVWSFSGVVASYPPARILDLPDRMPGARWFVGARLNFAENLLRIQDETEAIVAWNEQGRQASFTYAELFKQVRRLASSLRSCGIVAGDRVAGYLPNVPEAVIAMLAAASIGAVWSSCSPDFGIDGVVDRFGQIQPRALFTASSYQYSGRHHHYLDRVRDLLKQVPSIEWTVVVPYREKPTVDQMPPGAIPWEHAVELGTGAKPRFTQLPFDHPVYILYSSGTTGKPKCIVHGAGGTLLQHLKEHLLHTDLKRGDRMAYFTTGGWMMWNWLVSGLATGATIVLYDGSPMYPRPEALLDLAQAEKISVFGASAKYFSALEKAGVEAARTHRLPALRTILSTGSPLSPESFDYVYRSIKRDVHLASISGGTDIISCFALGNPAAPVYRGELQTRGLGMAVEVFSPEGKPVRGERGELVCTKPFPSMPVRFWNDPHDELYRAAYFSRFPGVWHHGDWAEITEHDGLIIHGRSDAVLNPGGVRIGTAEIYRVVEQIPTIADCLVAGQEWAGDVRIVLFVKLQPGAALDQSLVETIKKQLREKASPRHVPAKIIAVADIPRTINHKLTELAVGDIINNRPLRNTETLLNPEALDLFRDLPELSRP